MQTSNLRLLLGSTYTRRSREYATNMHGVKPENDKRFLIHRPPGRHVQASQPSNAMRDAILDKFSLVKPKVRRVLFAELHNANLIIILLLAHSRFRYQCASMFRNTKRNNTRKEALNHLLFKS